MPRDLTTVEGNNPAKVLQANYTALMAEQDRDVLAAKVTDLLKGSQISPKNLAKATSTVRSISSLEKLQFYVSNYILAGSGMATVKV